MNRQAKLADGVGTKKVEGKRVDKRMLNTKEANSSMWLLKIPNYIAEQWVNKESGDMLGNLSITNLDGKKKIKVKLLSEEVASRDEDVTVKDFVVEEKNVCKVCGVSAFCPHGNGLQLFAFNYDDKKEAFSVAGKITKNATLEPENNDDFGRMLKEFAKQAESSRPAALPYDPNSQKRDRDDAMKDRENPFILPTVAKKQRGKVDLTDLQHLLIKTLGKEGRMSLKELTAACDCSEPDIKPLLGNFCIFHKKGEFKFLYELKDEFKNSRVVAIPKQSSKAEFDL